MISFPKILLGFTMGSILLVIIAINLFSPVKLVSASTEIPEENAVATQEDLTEESITGCSISSNYPQSILQWCSPIIEEANKFNMDPNFIAAVMLQESGGDPNAYSLSGAVGLMQIMPKDGIAEKFMCINGPCFANRPSTQELFNPEFNIEYGVSMLSNLYGKFGSWRDALKAYGPMDVGYYYADLVIDVYENY